MCGRDAARSGRDSVSIVAAGVLLTIGGCPALTQSLEAAHKLRLFCRAPSGALPMPTKHKRPTRPAIVKSFKEAYAMPQSRSLAMNSGPDKTVHSALNRESITKLVTRFYDDVRADRVLGPTFEVVLGGRWASHLPRMVEFWSTVTLGTRSFTGNVFARHMAVPGVTPLHFECWMRLWMLHTRTLFDRATARQLQAVATGIARNLYRGYFGDPTRFDPIASEMTHDGR